MLAIWQACCRGTKLVVECCPATLLIILNCILLAVGMRLSPTAFTRSASLGIAVVLGLLVIKPRWWRGPLRSGVLLTALILALLLPNLRRAKRSGENIQRDYQLGRTATEVEAWQKSHHSTPPSLSVLKGDSTCPIVHRGFGYLTDGVNYTLFCRGSHQSVPGLPRIENGEMQYSPKAPPASK